MRFSASELSVGYRNHLADSGVDLALAAGEVREPLRQDAAETMLFRTLLELNPALGHLIGLVPASAIKESPARLSGPHQANAIIVTQEYAALAGKIDPPDTIRTRDLCLPQSDELRCAGRREIIRNTKNDYHSGNSKAGSLRR